MREGIGGREGRRAVEGGRIEMEEGRGMEELHVKV